jgi:aryl-alcohol dehydrogenase-like predicted oxidoreductase
MVQNLERIDEELSRLVLGTAQLGMPYGIANQTGKPNFDRAQAIVNAAWEGGIRCFDTAQAYGDSEQILGQAISLLPTNVQEALIVTKLDPMLDLTNWKSMAKALHSSFKRLRVQRLYALMFHNEESIPALNNGLKDLLTGYRRDGLISHIGISVYSPDKALQALHTEVIDLIQLPTNILDRRFLDAGVFHLAGETGKEIFIRSVFLQGLLLMDEGRIPATMNFARSAIRTFQKLGIGIYSIAVPPGQSHFRG